MGADFMPTPGADGWQLSNPPILGLAPLRGSLELFDRAGMAALREKSERLTGYLEPLIRERLPDTLQIATPREPERRGPKLSLPVGRGHGLAGRSSGRSLFDLLPTTVGPGDWPEPDLTRISPSPSYQPQPPNPQE